MQAVPRPLELRLLLPLVILVPLGFAVTHIAQTGTLDIGPMGVAAGYVGLMLGAHVALRLVGNRGDQLLLPCVATIGAIGIIMLNRLPQQLLGTDVLGVRFGMATTQLLWFAVGVSAMVLLAGRFGSGEASCVGFRTEAISGRSTVASIASSGHSREPARGGRGNGRSFRHQCSA